MLESMTSCTGVLTHDGAGGVEMKRRATTRTVLDSCMGEIYCRRRECTYPIAADGDSELVQITGHMKASAMFELTGG